MRSTLCVLVAISLVASPLAGCAASRGPRQIRDEFSGATPPESDWSRVGELAPGSEIALARRGAPPRSAYFVSADAAGVTVLSVLLPTVPSAAVRVLRNMATQHPEYFSATRKGETFAQNDVRVGRDGIFVANRKVADLEQVVETISRNQVDEIRGPVVARGSVPGAILGGWLGFAVGVIPGLRGASTAAAWAAVITSVYVGAYLGWRWSSHQTEDVVYRAP